MLDESAVNKQIASADQMLSGALDREHYFDCGRSALACIQKALATASIPPERIKRILDRRPRSRPRGKPPSGTSGLGRDHTEDQECA